MLLAGLLGSAVALTAPMARAADGQDNRLVYAPSFFESAHPQDALAMVERLPGFVLIDSDEDVRGLAGSAGNVLIDGRPPSSKSDSLEAVLKRIPATAVARIEVIRGGAPGIDMGGRAVVANVVRVAQATQSMAVTLGAITARDHVLRPNAGIEWARRSGEQRLDAAIDLTSEFDDDTGAGTVSSYTPAGALADQTARRQWEVKRALAGRGGWETPFAHGTLTTNASLARKVKDEDVTLSGPDGEHVQERKAELDAEAGLQWRRALGSGLRLDAFALQRLGRADDLSTSQDGADNERFESDTDTAESIARLVLRRERGPLAMEIAAEGAINSLDSQSALTENDVAVALPGSEAHVRELRGELTLGSTWQASRSLTAEASLAVERSTIRQRGDTMLSRSFTYWKPRFALSHALGGGDQLRASIERSAGQLDFGDFVASASLDRGSVSAGAVDLRPPRSWLFAAAYEHHFGDGGALVIEARHESVTDVVDHGILLDETGQAYDVVSNIGHGLRDTLSLGATWPLAPLTGLAGARIEAKLDLVRSRVTDPATAQSRWISKDKPVSGSIAYLHDLPGGQWSWSAKLALGERQYEYRLDEVRTEHYGARLDIHVDYRPAPAWTVRLDASNITALAHRDRREKYDGLRGTVAPGKIEIRDTATTPTLALSIRRSLGGRSVQ